MFQNNAFAKVWKVMDNGDLQISTSYKTSDGTYQTDFSSYVKNKSDIIPKEKDTIKLINIGVKTFYNKEEKTSSTLFYVFDLEVCDFSKYKNKTKTKTNNTNDPIQEEKQTDKVAELPVSNLFDMANKEDLPF